MFIQSNKYNHDERAVNYLVVNEDPFMFFCQTEWLKLQVCFYCTFHIELYNNQNYLIK